MQSTTFCIKQHQSIFQKLPAIGLRERIFTTIGKAFSLVNECEEAIDKLSEAKVYLNIGMILQYTKMVERGTGLNPDIHEIFVIDSAHISLGIIKAKTKYLEFNNNPNSSLLYLINKSKGKEFGFFLLKMKTRVGIYLQLNDSIYVTNFFIQ